MTFGSRRGKTKVALRFEQACLCSTHIQHGQNKKRRSPPVEKRWACRLAGGESAQPLTTLQEMESSMSARGNVSGKPSAKPGSHRYGIISGTVRHSWALETPYRWMAGNLFRGK